MKIIIIDLSFFDKCEAKFSYPQADVSRFTVSSGQFFVTLIQVLLGLFVERTEHKQSY